MNSEQTLFMRGALLPVFQRLGASTWLAMAAMVCKEWRALALECHDGARDACFRVSLWDITRRPHLLQWAKNSGLLPPISSSEAYALCIVAAALRAQASLIWLHANGYAINTWVCAFAAFNDDAVALLWARSVGAPWDETACELAAERGHLAMLQFLRGQQCPWDNLVLYRASLCGHREILGWAIAMGGILPSSDLMLDSHHRGSSSKHARRAEDIARDAIHLRPSPFDLLYTVPDVLPPIFARLGETFLALAACVCRRWRDLARRCRRAPNFRLELRVLVLRPTTMVWAVENLNEKHLPPTLRDKACSIAAQEGALEALKWLRADGFPWDAETCSSAARGGHLAILQWAREHRCDWDRRTCFYAASGGHLGALQWARENGCDWGTATCAYAAEGGHLEVLQWARENGCDWDKCTCANAAFGGHLEVLQWAHENGCDWDWRTCFYAARGGHLKVLQWAREHGCDWDKACCLLEAKNNEHEAVAAWIETQFNQQS